MIDKLRIVALSSMCFTSTLALAVPGLITGNSYTSPDGYVFQVSKTALCSGTPNSMDVEENLAQMTCQTKKGIQAGLKATSVALLTVTTACVNAPIPVQAKAILAGSGLMVGVVDMVVNFIPCSDLVDKRKQAEQFCKMLQAQGFACDVNAIDIKDL